MTLIDWLAILGALAWAPQLFGMLRVWLTKSRVRVITQRQPEIGFNTNGPMFNLRLAFSVENKDIVISDIKVRLTHESGEMTIFEWQGMTQHLGKMTVPGSQPMPFEKEQSVLAIKLNQKDIEERFVRFQSQQFKSEQFELASKSAKKLAYLQGEKKYDPETFLREEEMKDLYSFNKQAFSWKPGKYKVSIEMQSPEPFDLVDNVREFNLYPFDIEKLQKNSDSLEQEYRRQILNEPDTVVWQWCFPNLIKV